MLSQPGGMPMGGRMPIPGGGMPIGGRCPNGIGGPSPGCKQFSTSDYEQSVPLSTCTAAPTYVAGTISMQHVAAFAERRSYQRHGRPCMLHEAHDFVIDRTLCLRLLKLHVVVAHIRLRFMMSGFRSDVTALGQASLIRSRQYCNITAYLVLETRVVLLSDDRLHQATQRSERRQVQNTTFSKQ